MRQTAFLMLLAVMPAFASAQTPAKKLIITPGLTASVVLPPGGTSVKVLMPGTDTMDFDLSTPPGAVHAIKTADYNFDGLKDFAVTAAPAPGSNVTLFDIFLYSPAEKTFVPLELPGGGACDVFANVKLSAADKTLRTSCANEAPVRKLQTDAYKYTDAFTLAFDKTTGTVEEREPREPREPRTRREKEEDEED